MLKRRSRAIRHADEQALANRIQHFKWVVQTGCPEVRFGDDAFLMTPRNGGAGVRFVRLR
jgi:hypothetical protein